MKQNKCLPSLLGLLVSGLFASGVVRASDSLPSAPQTRPVAITNAVVHVVSGPTIERGTVVFDKGRITAIAADAAVPTGAEVIDAAGRHVYPGLMDACSQLGLIEIEAVRASRDSGETGAINPNARAERAINPDSEIIPTTRANGVLLSVVTPQGGVVSGLSACVRLDGWTAEEMLVRPETGLHINWPALSRQERRRRGGVTPDAATEQSQQDPLKEIRQLFADARSYAAGKAAGSATNDSRWEAMLPVLAGKVPVVANAESADQIASAVAFAQREKLKLIILGGADAAYVAPLLKERNIPVILGGVQRRPSRRMDAYDAPYTLPARLRDAGVKFAISADRGPAFARNLPYHAATAAAFGLTRDEAIRAITLSAAEIFGLQDVLGSLETGKEATLFLADGDILDTPTQVVSAWTAGRRVDMSSRHTRLWKKYSVKYEQGRP